MSSHPLYPSHPTSHPLPPLSRPRLTLGPTPRCQGIAAIALLLAIDVQGSGNLASLYSLTFVVGVGVDFSWSVTVVLFACAARVIHTWDANIHTWALGVTC